MPEALALARWLNESATSFGLAETAVPGDDAVHRAKRGGMTAEDWSKVGPALKQAAFPLGQPESPIELWLMAISDALALDPLEAEILALALHYRLDKRTERLFDRLSECGGGRERLHRDPALIALLLNVPIADAASRLTPDARLLASGLLRLERDGDLEVLERLTSLLRRDIPPGAVARQSGW